MMNMRKWEKKYDKIKNTAKTRDTCEWMRVQFELSSDWNVCSIETKTINASIAMIDPFISISLHASEWHGSLMWSIVSSIFAFSMISVAHFHSPNKSYLEFESTAFVSEKTLGHI